MGFAQDAFSLNSIHLFTASLSPRSNCFWIPAISCGKISPRLLFVNRSPSVVPHLFENMPVLALHLHVVLHLQIFLEVAHLVDVSHLRPTEPFGAALVEHRDKVA